MERLIREWDGEHVTVCHDAATGAWILIAVHSTRLGPGTGGTRLCTYASPRDALEDAMRLAEAMTVKFAVVGIAAGGGKAVLAVPPDMDAGERRGLFERYGDLLADLRGSFSTGPDLGTGPEDMDIIGSRTPHVFGRSTAAGGAGNSGPSTALGVVSGIVAAVARAFPNGASSDAALENRSVLVQGVGSVGTPLVIYLVEHGARVLVSDTDADAVARMADRWPIEVVDPERIFDTECDVFAPCATGRVLSADTVDRLRCKVVAGAANNQLETREEAESLHKRGILYAPDFVVNAGGALFLEGRERFGETLADIEQRVRGIGDTLSEIFDRAASHETNTLVAARAMAAERLAAGPERS